ncbi:hypothetical protein FRC09_000315 [Ceratobasidium sp. 395]|nr:hypothetical protein FRC09_000315 [Ceratobasidium sp. 395]
MRSFPGVLALFTVLVVRVAAVNVFERADPQCPAGSYYNGSSCQQCPSGNACPVGPVNVKRERLLPPEPRAVLLVQAERTLIKTVLRRVQRLNADGTLRLVAALALPSSRNAAREAIVLLGLRAVQSALQGRIVILMRLARPRNVSPEGIPPQLAQAIAWSARLARILTTTVLRLAVIVVPAVSTALPRKRTAKRAQK